MKSRTSFSKLTIFKRSITRFAPIWALYLIGMMLVLFDSGYYEYSDRFAYYMMPDMVQAFGIVNIIYAGVIAVMLFGDLYNTRMCYSLHTVPIRREGLLLSQLAAGILFSLVPNAVATLYLMFKLESLWFLALYWLLAATLQFIFFYGLATVSALLTGNRFAMLAVYAGFNFVSMLIYAVLQTIYVPMLTGVVADIETFTRFSPAVHLADQFDYFLFESYHVTIKEGIKEYEETHFRYLGLEDGWGYTAILGGLGLVTMGISVWLYRLRHLECAGDFVAFPKTKGVACVIITLCVALCFALVGEAIAGGYILWMAVGLVVGFFGSLMLLERRVKVFRKRTFAAFGALAVVVILSFLAVAFDWFGIVRWTPEPDRVASVTVANYRNYSYNGGYYDNRISVTLTEKEEIADIVEAHQDILARLGEEDENGDIKPTHYVVLTYKMSSGRTVIRAYNAPADGINYETISKYFYTPEQILGYTDPVKAAQNVQYLYSGVGEIPEEFAEKLFTALQMDCEKGYVLSQGQGGDKGSYLEYHIEMDDYYVSRSLTIMSGAENTLAVLNSPELMMGYTDWDKYIYNIEYIELDYTGVAKEHFEPLLTALRTDIENGHVTCDGWSKDFVTMISVFDGRYYKEFYLTADAENTLQYMADYEIFVKE